MITRAHVIAAARGWIGTPFRHQGRMKGTGKHCGLDCVGLPLCVAAELGLVDIFGKPFSAADNLNYSAQPLGRFVHEECQRRLIEKPIKQMRPGDVVTMRVPTDPCHVAILSEIGIDGRSHVAMIHAFASLRKVCEHVMDSAWRNRIEGCFSFPGVEL